MKTIKTSELSGAALDWAVAKCLGEAGVGDFGSIIPWTSKLLATLNGRMFRPSTNWAQGGPIIERERISIRPDVSTPNFRAFVIRPPEGMSHRYIGPTPLIAAMRCFCASRLGDEVEVPKVLL